MTDWYGYPYIALTGGADGALDSLDGSLLKDGDFAVVVVPGINQAYIYTLDADSGLAENSPAVISPDSNAGNKRWIKTNQPSYSNDIKYWGAIGDGATDDRTAAYNANAGATGHVRYTPGTYLIGSDLTLSTPILMEPGAMFSIPTGITLTISGSFTAGLNQAFSCAGTGKVVFSVGSVDVVRPEWWAVNTTPGTTNMQPAIQAALTAAPSGCKLSLLGTTYQLETATTQLLLISKPVFFEGAGSLSILQVDAAVGATIDVIRIDPDMVDAADGAFFALRDFAIVPESGTPGRDAIRIDVTTTNDHLKNMTIERVRCEALGGHAINCVNPTNTDGWFTSVIQDCLLVGGIYLDLAGDSMRIMRNSITGAGWGIYANLVSGANGLLIEGNNITSSEGCVYIYGTETDARILANNFESIVASTGADKAMVLIDSSSGSHRTTTIAFNTFSMLSNYADIGAYIKASRHARIEHNYFGRGTPLSQIGWKTTNVALNTFITGNLITDAEADAGYDDGGVGTCGIVKAIPIGAAYSAYNASYAQPEMTKDCDSVVTLSGMIKLTAGGNWTDGVIATLPAGFRPKFVEIMTATGSITAVGDGQNIVVSIAANGEITTAGVTGKAIAYLSFQGIAFRAYQ